MSKSNINTTASKPAEVQTLEVELQITGEREDVLNTIEKFQDIYSVFDPEGTYDPRVTRTITVTVTNREFDELFVSGEGHETSYDADVKMISLKANTKESK